jgi:restriction endonuclease Mrr
MPVEAPPTVADVLDVAEAAGPTDLVAAADLDLEELRELTQREFTLWCGRLFERFGYVVKIVEETDQSDCDLKISRNDDITIVDCRTCEEGRSVTRAECQTLIGAMVGSQVKRGMILATGAFDPACEDYAQSLQGMDLELIDGNELIETYRALRLPPLAKWFDQAA